MFRATFKELNETHILLRALIILYEELVFNFFLKIKFEGSCDRACKWYKHV